MCGFSPVQGPQGIKDAVQGVLACESPERWAFQLKVVACICCFHLPRKIKVTVRGGESCVGGA